MKLYADEANKKDSVTKQDRVLMTRLAKTISDNSKNLSELGMSPIILAKLQSLIPKEILNENLEYIDRYFENMDKDEKILWFGESGEDENVQNNKIEKTMLNPSQAPLLYYLR